MKRIWSQVDDSNYVVTRAIAMVKRRKLNSMEFPIPGLNEDVWCQALKYITAEQATILRMVCKYFRIERFVKKINGKEKKVKPVCKDAIIGTNNPTYLNELPGIRLTQEKLRVIKTRCYQRDSEVEMFKYVISCGTSMKATDWFDLALKGSRKALDWVKSLPIHWVTSRKGFMPGIIVRGDNALISEFFTHLKYQWTEERMYTLMDDRLTDGKGIQIVYDHMIGRKVIPQLGEDKTFALCIICLLITTYWYGPINTTKRAEALDMIEELSTMLDQEQEYNGADCINFASIDSTCRSFRYEKSILYKLLQSGNVAHVYMIWKHVKTILSVVPFVKVLVACPFDTTMMIRAVHKYVAEFTEDRLKELRDDQTHVLNVQVLDRVRNMVFGRTATTRNVDNINCYRQCHLFPMYQDIDSLAGVSMNGVGQ